MTPRAQKAKSYKLLEQNAVMSCENCLLIDDISFFICLEYLSLRFKIVDRQEGP